MKYEWVRPRRSHTGQEMMDSSNLSGGQEMHCGNGENQRKCHFFVSRIRTKHPIVMLFGVLISFDLDKKL